MSLLSFLRRSSRDPAYPFRKVRWNTWQNQPEREIQIESPLGSFLCSTRDQVIGRALYLTREFAWKDVERAIDLLVKARSLKETDNSLLFDVGANLGTTCIPLLRNSTFRRALAFEPEPKNVGFLRRNVTMNQLSGRIEIFPCALSDRAGNSELLLSDQNFGDHRVNSDVAAHETSDRRRVTIVTRTLDEICSERKVTPNLLWLDTQGHEAKVLRGAEVLLRTSSPPLVLEFWPWAVERSGEDVRAFIDRLAAIYPRFADLRADSSLFRPTRGLAELATRYAGENDYTDLVFPRPER